VPDHENMVDGAFLNIRIQIKQPVQHVTDDQVYSLYSHANVMAPGTTFFAISL